jgi:hypothetical protein
MRRLCRPSGPPCFQSASAPADQREIAAVSLLRLSNCCVAGCEAVRHQVISLRAGGVASIRTVSSPLRTVPVIAAFLRHRSGHLCPVDRGCVSLFLCFTARGSPICYNTRHDGRTKSDSAQPSSCQLVRSARVLMRGQNRGVDRPRTRPPTKSCRLACATCPAIDDRALPRAGADPQGRSAHGVAGCAKGA